VSGRQAPEEMVRVVRWISECDCEPVAGLELMPYSEGVEWLRERSKRKGWMQWGEPAYALVYEANGRLASWSLR
jgi:hypothetical protein